MLTTQLSTQPGSGRQKLRLSPVPDVRMQDVDCIILSGGQGTRLFPLTQTRCKPGVPFGGYYRLIDIALSNALSARCRKIYVVTQFFSSSLHQHIYKTYTPHARDDHGIAILTAEQRPSTQVWYEGTADAIRQNMHYLRNTSSEYLLVLSGDQLYNLDFSQMLRVAKQSDADLVVASLPVDAAKATRMGLLAINRKRAIVDFYEKPEAQSILKRFACPSSIKDTLRSGSDVPLYLASMGIYLFKRDALFQLLQDDPRADFGKHLIPTQISRGGCIAFLYDGYWEDIGTIESFYNTNIALTRQEPPFNFHSESLAIYTAKQHLPPAKILHTQANNAIFCDGSIVEADEVTNTIIGPRTVVRRGSVIRDSYLMGNESYVDCRGNPLQIGRDCVIRYAILDHDVVIGDDVQLVNANSLQHYDGEGIYIRDGVIIVSAGTSLPDGFQL